MVNFASEHMLPLARGTNKQLRSSYIRSFRLGKKEGEREGEGKGERGEEGVGVGGGGRSRLGDPS